MHLRLKSAGQLRAVLCAATVSLCATALAHGDWPPKHGGLMNEGGETSFELVQQRGGLHFYAEDHGTAVPTQGSKAVLTRTRAGSVATFEAKPVGAQELHATGASVRPGDKLALKVTFANGSIAVGRFTIPRPD